MRFHSIRRRLIPAAVVFAGLLISGLGFWLWDAKNYPLPASLEAGTTSTGSPLRGIRAEILDCRDQLKVWRIHRILVRDWKNHDLGKQVWVYFHSGNSGTLEFQAHQRAIFEPPIPFGPNTLANEVVYSRPQIRIVRLSWDRRQLDLELWPPFGDVYQWSLEGDWDGRPIVFYQKE